MEHHAVHSMHDHHKMDHTNKTETNKNFILALNATLHCLIGCGIGEVMGMIIGTALNMSMFDTTILSVIMGFVAGLSLGVLPLLKASFTLKNAFKTVLIGEGLSIVVMEAFEVLTQWMIPGVMEAHLTDMIFWIGMAAALAVGFIAALPVNYVMIRRGVRHQH
jgi:F0F1-type ATP synthase assembly protein I